MGRPGTTIRYRLNQSSPPRPKVRRRATGAKVAEFPATVRLAVERTRELIEWELDWAYEGLGRHDRNPDTVQTWRNEIQRLRAELAALDDVSQCATRTAAGYDERHSQAAA